MLLQIHAALFHFDEDDGFPDVIGEGGAAAVFVGFADAEFGGATGRLKVGELRVEGLAFFVAGDVLLAPGDEFGEFFPVGHLLGGKVNTKAETLKAEMLKARMKERRMGKALNR